MLLSEACELRLWYHPKPAYATGRSHADLAVSRMKVFSFLFRCVVALPQLNENFAGQSSQRATGKRVVNGPPRQFRRRRIELLAFYSKLKSTLDSS